MAELHTFARPYAKAAFEYALQAQDLAGWSTQLALLAALSQEETLAKVIKSPAHSGDEQVDILIGVAGDALTGKVQNFLKLLARNKRLWLLPQIAQLFEELKTRHEQAVDVELTTAMALDQGAEEKLSRALSTKLARKVNVRSEVDKRLLAGVIIKAGDLVIDGSMRGRLEKLAKAINS